MKSWRIASPGSWEGLQKQEPAVRRTGRRSRRVRLKEAGKREVLAEEGQRRKASNGGAVQGRVVGTTRRPGSWRQGARTRCWRSSCARERARYTRPHARTDTHTDIADAHIRWHVCARTHAQEAAYRVLDSSVKLRDWHPPLAWRASVYTAREVEVFSSGREPAGSRLRPGSVCLLFASSAILRARVLALCWLASYGACIYQCWLFISVGWHRMVLAFISVGYLLVLVGIVWCLHLSR